MDQPVQKDNLVRGPVGWVVSILILLALAALITGTTVAAKNVPVMTFCLAVGIVIGGGWLVKRGLIDRARLPRTALDLPLLLFLFGIFIAFAFSPVPRLGFDRLAWFIYAVIVYFALVDIASNPANRPGIRVALLGVTMLPLLAALLELYARYLFWWRDVGSTSIMPPYPFRFTSIIIHPNYFMGVINLVAPLAVLLFFQARQRAARVFAAFWLVMYAIALPFSSSRGGWVGTATWVGTLTLLWLIQNGLGLRLLHFFRRRVLLAIPLAAALLVIGGYAALTFYTKFAGAHPSHGSGTNLNRQVMWGGAVQIWQESPWVGSGLGRLGLEYMRVTNTFPATWWPPQAHSTTFQILGETGLAGFLPYLVLVAAALVLFIRAYFKTSSTERIWAAASLAALSTGYTHGFFDEFTYLPASLTLIAVQTALLLTAPGPSERYRRVPMSVLVAPAVLVGALGAFYLWGYAPLYQVTSQGVITDWQEAAEAAAESARRDPLMPYYQSQAGLAYAQLWWQTNSPEHFDQAYQYFARSLEKEWNNPLYWVDMALLHWYAGEREQALEAMQRAIALCSRDPNFYVNHGWMLEQMGRGEEAAAQYRQALSLEPRLASHPFWSATAVRREASAGIEASQELQHWQVSQQSLAAGDLTRARLEWAKSGLYDEPPVSRASTLASIAFASGGDRPDRAPLNEFFAEIETAYWGNANEERPYNHYFWRNGFQTAVVPGYIRVSEDAGQFENLRRLHEIQVKNGECDQAALTWQVLQRELLAGERPAGGYPPAPACP